MIMVYITSRPRDAEADLASQFHLFSTANINPTILRAMFGVRILTSVL